jgi:hypothetical protein
MKGDVIEVGVLEQAAMDRFASNNFLLVYQMVQKQTRDTRRVWKVSGDQSLFISRESTCRQ